MLEGKGEKKIYFGGLSGVIFQIIEYLKFSGL